ncbi:hypothetical protein ACLOJK_027200, partial [Asimina triloba]
MRVAIVYSIMAVSSSSSTARDCRSRTVAAEMSFRGGPIHRSDPMVQVAAAAMATASVEDGGAPYWCSSGIPQSDPYRHERQDPEDLA